MPKIRLAGQLVNVDIRTEVEAFDWIKPTWTDDKLIAASPFRYDQTPSFFVNLETGGFHDSGAYDADYERGNLPKLLAFLRDETYEETVEYLLAMYGKPIGLDGHFELTAPQLRKARRKITLPADFMHDYNERHPYLLRRGITEAAQRFMGVGYSAKHRAVVLPWYHPDGTLANVKYRKTQGKTFYYAKGAAPIRSLVYGLNQVYAHNYRKAYLCEAEIDALSWISAGRPAIAIGGASINDRQLDLIRKSPLEEVIICADNDKAGEKLRKMVAAGLSGHVRVSDVYVPRPHKDANEARMAGVDLAGLPVRKRHRLSIIGERKTAGSG